ncbi:MAG: type II toxin-antitoxin system RelB/DinJ family antitoxin [Synergistaceae bacterium]|jgi:DNA-damage-inducible protein J|nr:type II toxin-antitoxin system RelB/DinJ family antitoxin [Synergistaceae bacterium]
MPKTATLSIRVDPKIKSEAETLYSRYGLSLGDAVNVFLHQSLNVGGLPFDMRALRPNAVTEAAMREGDEIIRRVKLSGKGRFDSAEDMLADLKS